jgi:Cu2+-exporting ATPase
MNALAPATGSCVHCGTALADPDERFCCPACELAAKILAGAGLEQYYEKRDRFAPRPRPQRDADWSKLPVVRADDGTARSELRIDGFRCTACAWVCERVMERQPGVRSARVGFTTGRARIEFDPDATELARILEPVTQLGYRPAALREPARLDRDLLVRLGVATFAAVNVMMLSVATYLGWFETMEPRFVSLFRWTNLLLSTPVALWSALPFHRGAWQALRHRALSMDLPVSLAVWVMLGHGIVSAASSTGEPYLDSLTMLVALLLLGRVLEARGRTQATLQASSLAGRLPGVVRRLVGLRIEEVSPDELRVGDHVAVASGEEIGADGTVLEGAASIDTALMTGESEARAVRPGDGVMAGTAVVEGSLTVRVDATRGARILDRMQAALERSVAQPAGPDEREPTDALAPWFTGGTLALALFGGVGWGVAAGSERGVAVAVAILVVACPCALSLAAPLARARALGALARQGLLLTSAAALERLATADVVVLDKTGTLSAGSLAVTDASDEVLRVAAGLERHSVHPIARAIVDAAQARGIPLPRATLVRETPGVGVDGVVDGVRYRIGAGRRDAGGQVVEVEGLGRLRLSDRLRDDAAAAVSTLEAAALEVVLLTGDRADVAHAYARDAHIARVIADATPMDKVAQIERLQREGRRVIFVGDGLNDGPALRQADVGIAMGSGAAAAILAAHGVMLGERLAPIASGVAIARATRTVIRRTIRRSVVYNASAALLAVCGVVNPLVAAVLMPISSASVLAATARIGRRSPP